MVRSRLVFVKHLSLAVACLALCACGVEFLLHLHDAWSQGVGCDSERNACIPSWTVHHQLRPDARISVTDPDDGTEITWRTNSFGLRGPEIEIPKPAGVYRVVCLGDESTLAAETPAAETFCARLAEMLARVSPAKIEVVNAGCPQSGPLLSYLTLRHNLMALSPDLVILHFDMSDLADDHRCRRSVRMQGELPLYCPHPELERKRTAQESYWVTRLEMWRHGKRGLGYMLGCDEAPGDAKDIESPRGVYAWLRDDAPDWTVYVEQTLGVLEQMADLCRRSHCEFVLSAVPCPWQISAEASCGPGVRARAGVEEHALYANRAPFDTLADFASRTRVGFCDAWAEFRQAERPERLFRKNAARFSPPGHELYARTMARFLVHTIAGPWRMGTPSSAPLGEPLTGTGSLEQTADAGRAEFVRQPPAAVSAALGAPQEIERSARERRVGSAGRAREATR